MIKEKNFKYLHGAVLAVLDTGLNILFMYVLKSSLTEMKDMGIHEKRMARNLLFMELLNLNMYIHQKSSKAKQDNKNMYSGSQYVSMAS